MIDDFTQDGEVILGSIIDGGDGMKLRTGLETQ